MKTFLLQQVQESIDLKRSFFEMETDHILTQAADMAERLKRGYQILVCGNGGSAADAQHFAAELSGRYVKERRALASMPLTVDSSALTAIANDHGFDQVFFRQVEALAPRVGYDTVAVWDRGLHGWPRLREVVLEADLTPILGCQFTWRGMEFGAIALLEAFDLIGLDPAAGGGVRRRPAPVPARPRAAPQPS